MSITHRVKRLLGVSLAGAMVLALMPAGIAAADGHEDGESDGVEACEGSEGLVEFNDSLGFFESEIECMAAFGITVGDADGNYNSTGTVTRQQMALFIARLASQALNGDIDSIPESEDDAFDDIADINPPEARDAINWLAALEITVGAEGGDSYNPSGDVTRQQMASFIARAHVALGVDFDGIEVDDERFTDVDADNVHVVNINLLAAAGVVEGTGDGTTYSPANSVTRGQMSAFIVRSIGVLDSQGLWNGVFVVTPVVDTNQTFMVTPDELQTVTVASEPSTDDDVVFTVNNAVPDAEHQLALVAAADITVDGDGIYTFAETGQEADLAAANAEITVLNGVTVGTPSATASVTPSGSSFDFRVDAVTAETFWIVVYFDANDSGSLTTDADGLPVDAEPFGIGGPVKANPPEAALFDTYGGEVVEVNTDEDFYTLDTDGDGDADLLIRYALGDSFEYSSGALSGNPISIAQFEEWLSVGDHMDVDNYNPGQSEEQEIEEDVPNAPANLTASAADSDSDGLDDTVELSWDAVTNPDVGEYNIQRAEVDEDGVVGAFSEIDDVAVGTTTYDDAPATAGTYAYRVTAEASGTFTNTDNEGPASNEAQATIAATPGPTITSAELTTDTVILGAIDSGDVWTLVFSDDLDAIVDGDQIWVTDVDGDLVRLEDDSLADGVAADNTAATFTLTAADTLTVELVDDPTDIDVAGDGDFLYPATITATAGITSGGDVDLDNSTDLTIE